MAQELSMKNSNLSPPSACTSFPPVLFHIPSKGKRRTLSSTHERIRCTSPNRTEYQRNCKYLQPCKQLSCSGSTHRCRTLRLPSRRIWWRCWAAPICRSVLSREHPPAKRQQQLRRSLEAGTCCQLPPCQRVASMQRSLFGYQ